MSRARELLEKICAHGPDFINADYFAFRKDTIDVLLEAWTVGREKEIVDKARLRGELLIDHVVTGDYDVTLWRMPSACDISGKPMYAAAINNDQHDPHDVVAQFTQFPGTSLQQLPRRVLLEILANWVDTYREVYIGSGKLKKLASYKSMLAKYFNVIETSDSEGALFAISKKKP